MSYFDDASLVMIPSGYKTSKVYSVKPTDGTGDLTFTRSNDTATRVASNGLIEKVRTNLILQSQAFDTASWTSVISGTGITPTITANNATAPDGTMTADTIVFNAGAGTTGSDISTIVQSPTIASATYSGSFFARVASGTGQLVFRHAGGGQYTTANLTTTWQRFSSIEAGTAGPATFQIGIRRGLANEPINASVTVEIWGVQLEASDFGATDYIATTTAAVSVGPVANVPRLDYLNSSCPRLLLEPQRTNLLTYSEQINNAAWLNAGGTTTANTAVSPSGFQDADTLTGVRYQATFASNTYTLSVFAKKVDGDNTFVLRFDAPATKVAVFNLNNGTIVSTDAGYTSTITAYGNGWYRCTFTSPASTTISNAVLVSASAGVSSTFVYGCQLEVGSYATSYIPTLAAAVTRGEDAASKTGISSLIGQTEGTLFVEATLTNTSSSNKYLMQVSVNNDNRFFIYREGSTNKLGGFARVAATTIFTQLTPTAVTGTIKAAFAYKSGSFAFYVNGVQIAVSSATYTTPASINIFSLDSNAGLENGFFDYKQTLLFPTRLTNAQLAELTA